MSGTKNSGGRNKLPKIIKEMRGSLNVTRDSHPTPQGFDVVNYSMPTDLIKVEGAELIWNDIAPQLIRMKILKQSDLQALALYCNEFARYLKMATVLHEQGETYLTMDGTPRRRPEVQVMYESLRVVNTYQSRFGLTPADRDRLTVEQLEQKGIDDLIK
jgi:P27 family predicted phage terminase small subunit